MGGGGKGVGGGGWCVGWRKEVKWRRWEQQGKERRGKVGLGSNPGPPLYVTIRPSPGDDFGR
jgi:hypothetical protein